MLKNKYGAPNMHKANTTNPQKPGPSTQPPALAVKSTSQDVKKEEVKTKPPVATGGSKVEKQPPSAQKKGNPPKSVARNKKKKDEDK